MGEQVVGALDRHDGLEGLDLVALVERVHDEVVPAVLPAVVVVAAGAELEDRDRLVDPAAGRVILLEKPHGPQRAVPATPRQLLPELQGGVRVVALADALDGQAEDGWVETLLHSRGTLFTG